MADPFADPEFQDRLRKLLRMLASDQEQEADTARRKLLQHLAQHDLSANDLADRLSGAPSEELTAARTAARHAEQRAARAEQRRAQAEVVAASAHGGGRSGRFLRISLALLLLAVPCAGLVLLFLAYLPTDTPPRRTIAAAPSAAAPSESRAAGAGAAGPAAPSNGPPADGTSMFSTGGMVREVRQASEWPGAVVGADAELRSDMRPDALLLAVLQDGDDVTVQRAVTYQGGEWLQVATASGPGFLRASRVRRR